MLAEILIATAVSCTTASPDTLDTAQVSADTHVQTRSSSPVQSLGKEELRRAGGVQLHEAVKMLSGVSVKDYGGIGGLKTVSVRNMGAAHTAVCYDGIPISDAQNGQVDISRFFMDNISEIRVSIGAGDEIFRSARLLSGAGVLELRSEVPQFEGERTDKITAGISCASFGTYNPSLRYARKLADGWALTADAAWLTSGGNYPFIMRNGVESVEELRLNSDVNTINAELNLHGKTGASGRLTAKVNFNTSNRGLPGPVILYTQNPTERLRDRNILSSIGYEDRIGDAWRIRGRLSYSNAWNRYTDTSPLYDTPQDDRYCQQEAAFSTGVLYMPHPRIRIALAEDLFVNILDSNIPECPFPRRLSNLTAISGEYSGRRFKANAILLGTYITERTADGFPSALDRGRISPSVSVSYALTDDDCLRLRASYNDGYRVPTFNDLYYARVGNTSLVPEKASQFNLGLTWHIAREKERRRLDAALAADAYCNLVRDKITAIPTMFIWKMRNIGKVRMYGADLTATVDWKAADRISLHLRGGWSYQYAVDVTDTQSKNWKHQIPYTPRHTGNATFSLETFWITAAYSMNAVGRRYCLPQNIPANIIDAYADHNIALSRTFTLPKLSLHLSAEARNLSGNNYEVIRNYPMAGRSWRITLRINY